MNCPNENIEMQPVKAESHYGRTVLLDQCPKCGGIWFDKLELYMVKAGQADNIESIDPEILQTLSIIENSKMVCPRDQTKLIQFRDPYFPKDIIILRCPVCEGIWLNRGEFTKYQNFKQGLVQRSRERALADKKSAEGAGDVITLDQNGNVDTLERLGKFLNTPVDNLKIDLPGASPSLSKEEQTIGIALNVLALILRFFIRI